jgi:hypothetical protein
MARLLAFLAVLLIFALAWCYVREFAVLSNTIGAGWLAGGSMLFTAAVVGGLLWRSRARFTPWERHLPEVLFMLIFSVLFAPLFASWLNRGLGSEGFQTFEFVSETPYFASGYGVLKGEKLEPTGYFLTVKDAGRSRRFKYKSQRYYPLTPPGEPISLPVCRGLFGARVVLLR